MASQVAIHRDLKNPFYFVSSSNPTAQEDLYAPYEDGKILIFDNSPLGDVDYFLDHPGRWYDDWIPPIFSTAIQRQFTPEHRLLAVCDSESDILDFQKNSASLELRWRALMAQIFSSYSVELTEFSYRFNHLALGNLHLDVPDKAYEGHQFRWFINLDRRPRIIAVGPTIFELADMFWDEKNISRFCHLPVHEFIGAFRAAVLDKTIFRERELPRHYLTLDPGSMWLSHSSFISHGIVYGRKTACLEAHVAPSTLKNPAKHFQSRIRELQRRGLTEQPMEVSV